MAQKCEFAWPDATLRSVIGCTKVCPGCDSCYAERYADRRCGVVGHLHHFGAIRTGGSYEAL